MNRHAPAVHWTLFGMWMLMTPPTPLGTALPPMSEWRQLSEHKTAQDCEASLKALKDSARLVVTRGANAHALEVAAALGKLQSRCVESSKPVPEEPVAETASPAADGAPVDKAAPAEQDAAPAGKDVEPKK